MTKLAYKQVLGPSVRIGVLQNESRIRVSLDGAYRVVTPTGELQINGETRDFTCAINEAEPAALAWRLVIRKCFSKNDADAVGSPDPVLEPLDTVKLGVEFDNASAVEYWRCSKLFHTQPAAEECRAGLPHPERIGILKVMVTPPSGSLNVQTPNASTPLNAGEFVRFEPVNPETCRATVHDVIVGIEYHWRHEERQRFRGVIEVRVDNAGKLTAISELPVEAYLFSVNSSEMMSVMPDELLKAQTVAGRNTMFATMGKHHFAEPFDLCSDDHCQCYRGASRETPDSRRVTLATAGEVMLAGKEICDARYSKMCGGIIESFDSVWNEDPRVYLPAGVDADPGKDMHDFFPADSEDRAAALIKARPDCWCNTTRGEVPSYLTYSAPYFRWRVRYERKQLEDLLSRHVGTQIGMLSSIEPIKRGASGRLEFVKVVGSKGEWVIGKELQIRKAFSPTCLYSSAFIVEYERNSDGEIEAVYLVGAGWGHGAGLCQIGATMMAYKGRDYREILTHYYPNTKLIPLVKQPSDAERERLVSHIELRNGERCFEFYNCYAVAKCPAYLEKLALEATEISPGDYFFVPKGKETASQIEARCIHCEFLKFSQEGATPKK